VPKAQQISADHTESKARFCTVEVCFEGGFRSHARHVEHALNLGDDSNLQIECSKSASDLCMRKMLPYCSAVV
jgi:hypothetical protein